VLAGRVVQLEPGQEATCISLARDASVAAVGCRLGQVLVRGDAEAAH
jgi:hypothetical protein